MSLPTAPCTHCRTLIVYGQRRCHSCGTAFDYGAAPPPEPTPQQMREALGPAAPPFVAPAMQTPAPSGGVRPSMGGVRPALRSGEGAPVQASPQAPVRGPLQPQPQAAGYAAAASVPSGAPAGGEDFIDRGRFDEVSAASVQTEDIPGFVDSTLFKAFTPAVVETERVDGLEQTSYDDAGPAAVATEYVPVEHTAQESVGAVNVEDIPGFVDSTLFKAFTPAEVQTEAVEGLEVSSSAVGARPRAPRKPADDDGGLVPCKDCGTPHDKGACPSCGARRH